MGNERQPRFPICLAVALGLVAVASAGVVHGAIVGLGAAGDYNAFALRNVSASNISIGGRVAARGNGTFSSFSMAQGFNNSTAVVTGGNLYVTGGTIGGGAIVGGFADLNGPTFRGAVSVSGNLTQTGWGTFDKRVVVGGSLTSAGLGVGADLRVGGNLKVTGTASITGRTDVLGNAEIASPSFQSNLRVNQSVSITGGGNVGGTGLFYGGTYSGPSYITRTQAQNTAVVPSPDAMPFDFDTVATELRSTSGELAGLTANGSNQLEYSTRKLRGTRTDLNVFSLTAADFANLGAFDIDVPAGATTVINVAGGTVNLPNIGWTMGGKSLSDPNSGAAFNLLLWNFREATTLNLSSLGGSILAPDAVVNFSNGTITGTVVALDFNGQGALRDAPFAGAIPSASAMVGGIPEPAGLAAMMPAVLLLRRVRGRAG